MSKSLKLVVVGDGAVGKTCLLVVYASGKFPEEYVPTVFENYKAKVKVDQVEYSILLWDTAGQEELQNIRTLSYANTDVFLLCFSVVDRASYENLESIWIPEIGNYAKNPEFLLIGTKTDLRESTPENLSPEDGKKLAAKIGALGYVECSALKNENVKEVFDKAITEIIAKVPEEKSCCNIA
ncbi:Cdc42 like protein [Tritrichomonas foetus]|uniref:Cdc42 like protein n=1 Tax=Tritrichomonas foetus TaxID=1144522 RepID=A0A1J4K429_9EUKA|nr:Cdc42 like protein [Tritrichomonas foetus]|eukprot:OHT05722.1 Cdc42 like protein [Tritrichomonas foetus]